MTSWFCIFLVGAVLRVKYSKLGKVRFLGHRDVARLWERVLRRTRLPLAYTQGFSPHPKLAFGLALPVGWESIAEYLDVGFAEEVAAEEFALTVGPLLPAGFSLRLVGSPLADSPSLSELATVADYLVFVGPPGSLVAEGGIPELSKGAGHSGGEQPFIEVITAALSKGCLLARRLKGGEQIVEDVRPMILDISEYRAQKGKGGPCEDGSVERIFMRLRTKPYVLRPEAVVDAVSGEFRWHVHRVRKLAQYREEDGRLSSLDAFLIPRWEPA